MVNKKPKVKVGKAIPNGLDEGSMRMGSVDEDSSEYDDEDSTNKEATGQKKDGEDARISFKLPHMKKDAKAQAERKGSTQVPRSSTLVGKNDPQEDEVNMDSIDEESFSYYSEQDQIEDPEKKKEEV